MKQGLELTRSEAAKLYGPVMLQIANYRIRVAERGDGELRIYVHRLEGEGKAQVEQLPQGYVLGRNYLVTSEEGTPL